MLNYKKMSKILEYDLKNRSIYNFKFIFLGIKYLKQIFSL